MTTIATDGRRMAGDGLVTSSGGTIVGWTERKVVRIRVSGGGIALFGASGNAEDTAAAMRWLCSGCPPEKPSLKSFNALLLTPIGCWRLEERLVPMEVELPATIGSGRDHAMTALDLGKSPIEAIRAAALRDVNTGGEIYELELEK